MTRTRTTLADREDFANVLYYGKEGTAKTTNLAALSRLGPIVHIDAESGAKPLALRKRGIDPAMIEPFYDITVEGLEKLWVDLKTELEADPKDAAVTAPIGVMFDSTTEILKALMDKIQEVQQAKAVRLGKVRDPNFKDRADWGTLTDQMRQIVRRFRDLPCHVGFGALLRRDVDENGGGVTWGPAMTPGVANDLKGYVDIILYTEVIELDNREFYIGRCSPTNRQPGKDRFDILPKSMVNPTFDRVVEYLRGDLDRETDPLQIEIRELIAAGAPATPVPETEADNEVTPATD